MSAVSQIRTRHFPGRLEAVGQIRWFVAGLVDGLPRAYDITLCASELAANAIEHTASGEAGGTVEVRVDLAPAGRPGALTLAVVDQGPPRVPHPRRPAEESGRGLLLVGELVDDICRTATTTTITFDRKREGA
ncbi:ATP-binding protein [Streptosporangium sp. NPDC051022]|uniref:ATP-binding protein n=1 Tax=Streptosporangium sp. NPDC051022 TaxID=3155752 RepID=UPI00341AD376